MQKGRGLGDGDGEGREAVKERVAGKEEEEEERVAYRTVNDPLFSRIVVDVDRHAAQGGGFG